MRNSTINIAVAAGSTLFAVFLVFAALEIYLVSCRSLGIDAHDRLRHSKFIHQFFTDQDCTALLHAVTEQNADRFKTIWDFNETIGLSRGLFIPTEMFGEQRYIYRPHLDIYYARVWTGFSFQSLIVPATARITQLIAPCHTFRMVSFRTDANGFKNADAVYRSPGPTILFLGDSFTEGLWMAPERAFPQQCAGLLRAGGSPARVFNLGVNGYSALEMRWTLEHFAPSLSPQIAVMNLFLNDVDVNVDNVVLDSNIPPGNYDRMFADIDSTLEFSRRHGILLYVSIIPAKEQFLAERDPRVFQRRVEAWCASRGVRCVDPYDSFAQRGGEELYFDWDPHFTEEGHRVYAQFLAAELRRGLAERSDGESGAAVLPALLPGPA